MTGLQHSSAPWSYEYNPYRVTREPGGIETERAAFEVFDADGNKVFDTNEDTPMPNFKKRMPVWGQRHRGCWPHSSCVPTYLPTTTRPKAKKARHTARQWLPSPKRQGRQHDPETSARSRHHER